MEDTLSLFQGIGLSEAKAKDTIKNVLVSNSLKSLILEVQYLCFKKVGLEKLVVLLLLAFRLEES